MGGTSLPERRACILYYKGAAREKQPKMRRENMTRTEKVFLAMAAVFFVAALFFLPAKTVARQAESAFTLPAEMILKKNFEYRILTAESGMRGYELMQNQTVHLVLLDVSMPVWDGIKTLQFIRSNEKLKNTPVIMLPAAADRETVVKASSYGVKDYLLKPVDPEE